MILDTLIEEIMFGKKFEQLGCVQHRRGDGGTKRTRQPTAQMSTAGVQGYLRATSGARMAIDWQIRNIGGQSVG